MFGKSILEKRLQAEVEYLRKQNKMLIDRLMAIFDSKTYSQIKQQETTDHHQVIAEERAKKTTMADIRAEQEMVKEQKIKEKVLNQTLGSMMGQEV